MTSFLRLPQVIQRTGMSRSAIYKMVSDGTFPRPVRLGARAVAWVESEIQSWSEARIVASGHERSEPYGRRQMAVHKRLGSEQTMSQDQPAHARRF
jgi:prophage regulatory protein